MIKGSLPKFSIWNILIFLTAISFVTHIRLVNNLLLFDVLTLAQVICLFLTGTRVLSKITVHLLICLNTFLLLSFILLPFAEDISGSLVFLIQYLFTFNILPLYIDWLIRHKKINWFLKSTLYILVLNSVLFIFFSLTKILYNPGFTFLYFGQSGLFRFSWGHGIVSNDLIHYYILALFIVWFLYRDRHQIKSYAFFSFSFLFTLSRTFMLISFIFLIAKFKFSNLLVISIMLVALIFTISKTNITETVPNLNRLIYFKSLDYSSDGNSQIQGRSKLQEPIFKNIEHFLFFPLYGNPTNLKFETVASISSVHNVFLSIMVNFGILSLAFLICTVLIYGYKLIFYLINFGKEMYQLKVFLLFVMLDILVISFNALMTSRAMWFSLFVYIYLFYTSIENHIKKTPDYPLFQRKKLTPYSTNQ